MTRLLKKSFYLVGLFSIYATAYGEPQLQKCLPFVNLNCKIDERSSKAMIYDCVKNRVFDLTDLSKS